MNQLLNRVFKLWAFTVSHGVLIIRSPLKFPDEDGFDEHHEYNIDIEFSSVVYMEVPSVFKGIEIEEILEEIPERLVRFKIDYGCQVYRIKSENNMYFIVAGSYRIGNNKWADGQDKVFNMNLEYDSIIADSRST